jgi:hypothetical protein
VRITSEEREKLGKTGQRVLDVTMRLLKNAITSER